MGNDIKDYVIRKAKERKIENEISSLKPSDYISMNEKNSNDDPRDMVYPIKKVFNPY